MAEKLKTVCCYCRKKVKNEAGDWQEGTFSEKEENLSHGRCPECSEKAEKELELIPEK